MIDAVLSVHTNPIGCGVAKWNRQLAQQMGVPFASFDHSTGFQHPLISVRWSEMAQYLAQGLAFEPHKSSTYDLFLHDIDDYAGWSVWALRASTIYAANETLAEKIRPIRPDVITAFCPGTVEGDGSRGFLDILAFGMAHRFQARYFEQLRDLLGDSNYTISLSTAIHEGRSWDEDFTQNMDLMREVFGRRLRCLGFLADDGLRRMLTTVNAVALFFEGGVRANNTSFWSVMAAGIPVVTNLDAGSPPELKHGVNVFDIAQMQEWPQADQRRIQRWGAVHAAKTYSWDRLVTVLTAKVPA